MRYLYLTTLAFLLSFKAFSQCNPIIGAGTPRYVLDTTYITYYADYGDYSPLAVFSWYSPIDGSTTFGDSVTYAFTGDDTTTIILNVTDTACAGGDTSGVTVQVYKCSFLDPMLDLETGAVQQFCGAQFLTMQVDLFGGVTGATEENYYYSENFIAQVTASWGNGDTTLDTSHVGDSWIFLGYNPWRPDTTYAPLNYNGVYNIGFTVKYIMVATGQSCPDFLIAPTPYGVGGNTAPPLITGNTILCVGDTLSILARDTTALFHNLTHNIPADSGLYIYNATFGAGQYISYFTWASDSLGWTGRPINDSTLYIPSVTLADSGVYVFNVGNTCSYFNDTLHVKIGNVAGPILGTTHVCAGDTIMLADTVVGGVWSSNSVGVATVDPVSGIVTGIHSGTDTIYYSFLGTCTGAVAKRVITVDSAAAIYTSPTGCAGTPVTLDAYPFGSGGTWSSSILAIASVSSSGVVTGLVAGTTDITHTSPAGCSVTRTFTVNPLPTINIVLASPIICGSSPDTLIASGGGNYAWSPGVFCHICSLTATSTPGTYTVTGTDVHGCVNTASVAIIAGSLPTVTATNNGPLCEGGTLDLFGTISGLFTNYYWAGPLSYTDTSLNPVITGAPATSTGTYTFFATNICGTATGTTSVVINANPVITATSTYPALCTGAADALNASGAFSYNWSPATGLACASCSTTDVTIAGTYTVTGIGSGGCTGTGVVTITGDAVPTVTVNNNGPLCPGEILDLTSIISAGSALTTTWTGPDGFTSSAADTAIVGISPANEGDYTLVVVNSCGSATATTTFAISTPTITITATPPACGDIYALTAAGASTYTWLPSTGLSCVSCASPSTADAITYTVTGTTTAGCVGSASYTIGGNRISGYVSFSGPAPDTLDTKVWLIQFNPADSSLTAMDSMVTCLSAGTPYYEFDGVAAGSYMAKAALIYGNTPGSSGYLPTYSLSSPYWDTAATVTHAAGLDSLHISMVYGTVPPGPGFIGGLITSGADRSTSTGVPVVGMLVYLKNTYTHHIITYTYTDSTGAYAFSGLSSGNYQVFPEDYQYRTTVSADISLAGSSDTATGVNFKQHTLSHTITPYIATIVKQLSSASAISIYPNPTGGKLNIQWQNQLTGSGKVMLTDVTGREVYSSALNINAASGETQLDLSGLKEGIYLVSIRSEGINYTGKLTIQY